MKNILKGSFAGPLSSLNDWAVSQTKTSSHSKIINFAETLSCLFQCFENTHFIIEVIP